MVGCGPGGSCCGNCQASAMGAFDGPRYPNIESVLKQYVNSCLASGQDFYISPALNSASFVMQSGMGATILDLNSIIGQTATDLGAIYRSLAEPFTLQTGPSIDPNTFATVAAPSIASQGITLPSAVATQAAQAGLLDIFGTGTGIWLFAAFGGLLAVALFHRRKKRRGNRR